MAKKGFAWTSKRGTRLLIIPSTGLTSDTAEKQKDGYDLIIGFSYTYDPGVGVPQMIMSLRSHQQFDCATFCKANGGGGHTKAAGCAIELQADSPNPYKLIPEMIDAYETPRT